MTTITTRSGKGSPLTNDEVDANFTGLNTDKVETSGDSMTGDLSFGDNVKATFGSDDLQIYHDASHSFIKDAGTGHLKIQATNLKLQDVDGNNYIDCIDGSYVRLMHNTATKLETSATGIDVTGTVTADGLTVDGDGSFTGSFEISGLSPKIFLSETDTTDLNTRLRSAAGKLQIQTVDNSDANPVTRFQIDHATGDASIPSGDLDVTGTVTADGLTVESQTGITLEDAGDSRTGKLFFDGGAFQQQATGSGDIIHYTTDSKTARHKISSNGDISFYEDTGTTAKLFWDASTERLGIGNSSPATALDVTGSVTADGLTVDGAIAFTDSGSSNRNVLYLDGSDNVVLATGTTAGARGIDLYTNNSKSLSVAEGGDISFYEDTGTTAKFFWDSSAESLGIGTSSPAYKLDIYGSSTTNIDLLHLLNSNNTLGCSSGIMFENYSGGGLNQGRIKYLNAGSNNSNSFVFEQEINAANGLVETMRIDSSGNFGLGVVPQSSSSPTWQHIQFGGTGNLVSRKTDTTVDAMFASNYYVNASEQDAYITTGAAARMFFNDNVISFDQAASGTGGSVISWSEAMRIDSSGNVGIGESAPDEALVVRGGNYSSNQDGGIALQLGDASGSHFKGAFKLKTSSSGVARTAIDATNGTTGGTIEAISIANATGNVGIGTDSPVRNVSVYSSASATMSFHNSTTGSTLTDGLFIGNDANLAYFYNYEATPIVFATSNTERMRIDSSGILLVGKTSAGINGEGFEAAAAGYIAAVRDGGPAAYFQRKTSDGEIVNFRKDGTTVGSIGAISSDLEIHSSVSGHVGIRFANGGLFPTDNSGTVTNGAADLGNGSYRFKDLYLSGGAYLGGTGSANKLDDYEQGSWTPTADFSTTSPTSGASTGTGRYTKVGNVVTVWCTVSNFNVTGAAGDLNITGLPFLARLATNIQRYTGTVRITNCDFSGFTSPIQVNSQVLDNSTVVTVMVTRDDTGSDSVGATELTDGVSDINFTLTYETDA